MKPTICSSAPWHQESSYGDAPVCLGMDDYMVHFTISCKFPHFCCFLSQAECFPQCGFVVCMYLLYISWFSQPLPTLWLSWSPYWSRPCHHRCGDITCPVGPQAAIWEVRTLQPITEVCNPGFVFSSILLKHPFKSLCNRCLTSPLLSSPAHRLVHLPKLTTTS